MTQTPKNKEKKSEKDRRKRYIVRNESTKVFKTRCLQIITYIYIKKASTKIDFSFKAADESCVYHTISEIHNAVVKSSSLFWCLHHQFNVAWLSLDKLTCRHEQENTGSARTDRGI